MKDNFNITNWNLNRRIKEEFEKDKISINQVAKDIAEQLEEVGYLNVPSTSSLLLLNIRAALRQLFIKDLTTENKEVVNHPQFALDILNSNRKQIEDIYKKYSGMGQKANRELGNEIMNLLKPQVMALKISSEDKIKVLDFAKEGLASFERSNVLKKADLMNEAYEPKHFDICPGAQALRKRIVDGGFGDIKEFDLDKWTKLHDTLFALEKKVLKDKEAEDSDVSMAEKLSSEIINLSRDINIPSEAIGYLKGHVDVIKNISDYSELTENIKETILFIKENNPEFTNEEIKADLKEIKELGEQLNEAKLCKRGKAYIAARKRAGEKSSAYLSGRAVKVCKGQIKGTKGKRRKDYKGKK